MHYYNTSCRAWFRTVYTACNHWFLLLLHLKEEILPGGPFRLSCSFDDLMGILCCGNYFICIFLFFVKNFIAGHCKDCSTTTVYNPEENLIICICNEKYIEKIYSSKSLKTAYFLKYQIPPMLCKLILCMNGERFYGPHDRVLGNFSWQLYLLLEFLSEHC